MTKHPALVVSALLWTAWVIYWFVCARDAKVTRWREPLVSELRHRVPVWIAAFLLVAPRWLPSALDRRFLPGSGALSIAGVVLVVAGLSVSVWARVHLGRNWSAAVTVKEEHALVTSGPYAYVRHPIYTGILLAIFGTALAIGEWRGLLALLLIFLAFLVKSRAEEERMRATFPSYGDYRRRTKALVPFLL